MRLRVLIVALLPVLAITVVASAFGGGGQSELSALRQGTERYHDLQAAIDAGYITELPQTAAFGGGTCIANGAEGAMGIHMLDTRPGGRLDGNLDPSDPEALLYEKRNDGTFKLTGVEYIVAGGSQPELYGQEFADTNLARFGNPSANVWTLHAWVWKPNPGGMFDPWNTRVTC
jgi:hypothetical protein